MKKLAILLVFLFFILFNPIPNHIKTSVGDPVVNYLFYPNAQIMTPGLKTSLCREMLEVEESWGPPPPLAENVKRDLCTFSGYQNPKYIVGEIAQKQSQGF